MPRTFWLSLALLLCAGCRESAPAPVEAVAAIAEAPASLPAPRETLLDDISGVWRGEPRGLLYLLREGDKAGLFVGDNDVVVRIGNVDPAQGSVNLVVPVAGDNPVVWTVRKRSDSGAHGFRLVLTLHDGQQEILAFVREVSDDDRRHLARVAPRLLAAGLLGPQLVDEVEAAVAEPDVEMDAPAAASSDDAIAAGEATKVGNADPEYDWPVDTREGAMRVPRFDCDHPLNDAVRLVCSTPELKEMDRRMAGAVHHLLGDSKQPSAERAIHQRWLAEMSGRCVDVGCLRKAYEARFKIFEGAHAYSEYVEW